MMITSLPEAPASVLDEKAAVRFGQYAGAPERIDWTGLAQPFRRHPVWQALHHKHWNYAALATDEIFCGIAIVDVGWTNTAFAYVFDRRARKIIASYSQDGLPGLTARLRPQPAAGAASHFQFLRNRIHFQHVAERNHYQLSLACGDFRIEAYMLAEDAARPLFAVGTAEGGTVHATLKSAGMRLQGSVSVAGRQFDLTGGIGSYDHSNGFLGRETAWRWASAHSLGLGFNLQAGYFGQNENALWLDGELIKLGAAHFDYQPQRLMDSWHIVTDDGLLNLHFQPEGLRQENKNLLIAASRYVQPIGCFNGWVKAHASAPARSVTQLVGVTEDHFSRW
ncbi:DUF2804 domain-containing protein [Undibacterium crateris]|uniref:DUF2804 domain-containing protein n=1 Tax=Undibacterium crateris TaxID=2528175 RepID=UPI001F39CE02|nr:DUF2804 domain-containing protein [Undibacterium crateris]